MQQGIERVYDVHSYADEKRQALQLWADHIARIVAGDAGAGKVVALLSGANGPLYNQNGVDYTIIVYKGGVVFG